MVVTAGLLRGAAGESRAGVRWVTFGQGGGGDGVGISRPRERAYVGCALVSAFTDMWGPFLRPGQPANSPDPDLLLPAQHEMIKFQVAC